MKFKHREQCYFTILRLRRAKSLRTAALFRQGCQDHRPVNSNRRGVAAKATQATYSCSVSLRTVARNAG